eukprot:4376056-Karenia_brevis.AAC.1
MKVQGATLEHMVFWYDVLRIVPAAVYVALSRVRHDADWYFFGKILYYHCTPADGTIRHTVVRLHVELSWHVQHELIPKHVWDFHRSILGVASAKCHT